MRILVLSDPYPPYYIGGHEIQCEVVADGLVKRKHEVFVLTSKYGLDRKIVENNTFRLLHHWPILRTKGFKRRYEQLKIALLGRLNYFITKQITKKIRPEVAYVGYIGEISIFPVKAIQSLGIPIVYHLGSYLLIEYVMDCILEKNLPKRFWRKIVYGFYNVKKFDFNHIITISEAVKKKHVEFGFSESNISVIPRGISAEPLDREIGEINPLRDKQIRLLYVGRIIEEKGVHIALSSVGHLINCLGVKNIMFDIIGESSDDYKKRLQTLIRDLKIEKNVRFKGKIIRNELINLYKEYSILLFPSLSEALGGVIIEAMCQGLPIVATNVGGIPELITHDWNGLLVPPNDPVKMAESVKRLIENPSLAEKFAMNGIDLISKRFNNKEVIDQVEDYLNNVISSKGKSV